MSCLADLGGVVCSQQARDSMNEVDIFRDLGENVEHLVDILFTTHKLHTKKQVVLCAPRTDGCAVAL